MVTTITTNPMLDKTLYLPKFETGKIFRSSKVEDVAGGKGINVSLQLKELGIESVATGFLAGDIGNQIKGLLDKDDIKNDFVFTKGNTRIGFTVLDESNMEQTSVFEPNHKVDNLERKALIDKCVAHAGKSDFCAVSGSVPDSSISDIYREIISAVREANSSVKVFFDSYGPEFFEGIKSKPFCVKQNKKECEDFLNVKLKSESDFLSALKGYDEVEFIIITNGDNYSFVRYGDSYFRVLPPKIDVVNPIGCGDTMTAGLIYAFIKNYDITDVIKFGYASAAANAERWVIAKNKLIDIEKYINKVEVTKI